MHKLFRLILFSLLALAVLSSCSLGKKSPSDQDPNAVYTSAAQTVSVQLTANATRLPSATNQAPLATPSLPQATSTPPATSTSFTTSSVSTPIPTRTITMAPVNDRVEYVSQIPVDGSILSANQSFTTTWTIKNSGLTTWTTTYQLRFFSGDRLGSNLPTSYPLTAEVKPGESIQISVPMVAPSQPGEYSSNWVLTNQNLLNFYPLYITIKVTSATLTPTPTTTIAVTPAITETTEGTTP